MVNNVRKLKGFPQLSKIVGARRAKKLLKSVLESEARKNFVDVPSLRSMFVWSKTTQGWTFWMRLYAKTKEGHI